MFAGLFCTTVLGLMEFCHRANLPSPCIFLNYTYFFARLYGYLFCVCLCLWVVAHAWCMCRSQSIICRNPHPRCSPQWILGDWTHVTRLGSAFTHYLTLLLLWWDTMAKATSEKFIIVGLHAEGEPMTGMPLEQLLRASVDWQPLGWEKVEWKHAYKC